MTRATSKDLQLRGATVEEDQTTGRANTIHILVNKKHVYLTANSGPDMDNWINAIRTNAGAGKSSPMAAGGMRGAPSKNSGENPVISPPGRGPAFPRVAEKNRSLSTSEGSDKVGNGRPVVVQPQADPPRFTSPQPDRPPGSAADFRNQFSNSNDSIPVGVRKNSLRGIEGGSNSAIPRGIRADYASNQGSRRGGRVGQSAAVIPRGIRGDMGASNSPIPRGMAASNSPIPRGIRNGSRPPPPPLPPSWEEVIAADGRMYYWNLDTNETAWDRPSLVFGNNAAPPPAPPRESPREPPKETPMARPLKLGKPPEDPLNPQPATRNKIQNAAGPVLPREKDILLTGENMKNEGHSSIGLPLNVMRM